MSNSTSLVSIVVPCYNSQDLVVGCLNNFLTTRYSNFEIIVVDDVSTDSTFKILQKHFGKNPQVRLLRNSVNSGPSRTRNRGIAAARGEFVAFLETDMEVDPNWLGPLVNRIRVDKHLAAVQSKVLDLKRRDLIQAVGVVYDPYTFWVVSLGCGQPKESIQKPREVSVGAVGSLYRKSVLDHIGGFDEQLTHNVDDIDLGWRAWIAGYRMVTVPQSITYHWTFKPMGLRAKLTPSVQSEFHFQKTPRIFLKNYEWVNVVRFLPWVLGIFAGRALIGLAKGNANPLRGFVKSMIWNLAVLPDTLGERSRIQRLRKRNDNYILQKIALRGNFFDNYYRHIYPTLVAARKGFAQANVK